MPFMWTTYKGGYMLVKCSECGKEISDKAQTCIHCGGGIDEQVSSI